ncbi:hypothetical protein HYQ46_009249 [Verticillium longisporum]|nr:hypothetical protein HYQ46_009249 [Verticillium longisporum]
MRSTRSMLSVVKDCGSLFSATISTPQTSDLVIDFGSSVKVTSFCRGGTLSKKEGVAGMSGIARVLAAAAFGVR